MKEHDIFSGAALEKYMGLLSNVSSFSSGADAITSGRLNLKKWKMETGDFLFVVPVALHMPFNPVTGEMYPAPRPIIGSVESAIRLLKLTSKKSPAVMDSLKRTMGAEDFAVINFDEDGVSQEEMKVFWPYRQVIVYAATVMTVRPIDSKYPFGTPYRVKLAVDPDTRQFIDDPSNPIIYSLYQFESSCIASIAASMRTENDNAGSAKRTQEEMKDRIKKLWESRCISNPYSLGTTRVLVYKTDRNYEIDRDIIKAWKAEAATVQKAEYYIKINKKILDQYNSIKDSKYDRYADFLLVKTHVDEFTEDTIGTAAQGIGRSGASTDERIESMLPEFTQAYKAFRDDLEKWDESVLMSSAFEYRTISDDNILNIFKNAMPQLEAAMKTPAIVEKYGEIMSLVDSQLSAKMLEASMMEDEDEPAGVDQELANQVMVDENTEGYGGDTMGVVESAMTKSDASSLVSALVGDEDEDE